MRTALRTRLPGVLPALLLLAACADEPTSIREPHPGPGQPPRVLGVYEITLTGIGTRRCAGASCPCPAAEARR